MSIEPIESPAVMVRGMPEESVEKLCEFARLNGVGSGSGPAIRWASLQYLKILEAESNAQRDSSCD